jgi:hypothetical protein
MYNAERVKSLYGEHSLIESQFINKRRMDSSPGLKVKFTFFFCKNQHIQVRHYLDHHELTFSILT